MAENFDENLRKSFEDERRRERERAEAAEQLKKTWQSISSEIFGISGAPFWSETSRSYEDIEKTKESLKKIKNELSELNLEFGAKVFEKSKKFENQLKEIDALQKKSFEKLSIDDVADFSKSLNALPSDLQSLLGNLSSTKEKFELLKILSDETGKGLMNMDSATRKLILSNKELFGISDEISEVQEKINQKKKEESRLNNDLKKTTKQTLSVQKLLTEGARNFRSISIKTLGEWDRQAKSVQRESGIMLSNLDGWNVRGKIFASEMAVAGMTIAESTQFVAQIGEELRTANLATANIAMQWRAVSMATGISTKEVAEFGGNLMKMGRGAEDVYDYFEQTNKEAKALGLNSRRIFQSINQNLLKMQAFGFVKGEKSLNRMALRAEQLRISMDSVFAVAEKARTIEGSMDMAAQLQLAGGSFSMINPIELLSAARTGPDEMLKLLSRIGADIGKFNEKGEFQIDPIDADRLRIVAEATGMQYNDLFEMIRRNAVDTQKFSGKMTDAFFERAAQGLENFDAAMVKSAFSDLLEFRNGEAVLTVEGEKLLKERDINDWKNINEKQLASILQGKEDAAKSLEQQMKENMDMKKSVDALISSLANTMVVFQPIINTMTGWINSLNTLSDNISEKIGFNPKLFLGAIVGLGSIIGPVIMQGFSIAIASKFGAGIGGGISGLAGGMRGASETMTKMNWGGLLKFSAALAIVGTSIVGFSAAMANWGGEASMKQMTTAAASLVLLGVGVAGLSQVSKGINPKRILVASASMILVSAGIAAFGLAAQQMNDVQWGSVLKGLGMFGLTLAALTGIGALFFYFPGFAFFAGAGLISLIAVAGGLAITGKLLASAANYFNKLASVDWSGFSNMGAALLKASPGIAAFGLSTMAFTNPLAVLGMTVMVNRLGKLSAIMDPLSISLDKSATAMERFVSSFKDFKSSVKSIDLSNLEQVKDIVDSMEKSTRSTALNRIASTLQDLKATVSPSGGSKDTREIKIRLYLPNGREIKHTILEDTSLQA